RPCCPGCQSRPGGRGRWLPGPWAKITRQPRPPAACVSELAANAISHTRSGQPGGTFTVSVHDGGDTARIAVTDASSTAAPRARGPRPASRRGRGLAIVAALSAAWGYEGTGGGQVTWCHIHASDTTAA